MMLISRVFTVKSGSEVLSSAVRKSPFHVGTPKKITRQFISSSSFPLAEVPQVTQS